MNHICKKPLFNDLNSLYSGAICHKEFILFLNPSKCEVLVFDHCLEKVGCIKTERYQSITENRKECSFILTKVGDSNFLYKATYDFLEFDCIKLNVPNKYREKINDIYYDEENCRIYITTIHYVYSVTLDGYFIKEELSNSTYSHSNMIVKNLNGCCITAPTPVKNTFEYTAVGKCSVIYVSYTKNNETFLTTLKNDECKNEICLGEDIRVVSIFTCHHKLYLLVIKCEKYNYLYELNIKCEECDCKCVDDDSHLKDNPCCKKFECVPKCHHCNDPVACVLESIALEQTALSHILNAEGEKIQKAIASDAKICDLLEVNKSVTDTIFNATILEHILQEKISKVLKYEQKKPKPC